MTQKLSSEKLMATLLQSIDPGLIADEGVRQTLEVLLNLVEQLNSKVKQLEEENQKLRDENNRLKGELGKPDIKVSKKRELNRTYAKTPYIAHDNFDELHYSHVRSPNYFYSKTFSFSTQITFILIEGCCNWSVRYFDNNPCLT